jgi:hypothetical protein
VLLAVITPVLDDAQLEWVTKVCLKSWKQP